jgi:hypothetical protein
MLTFLLLASNALADEKAADAAPEKPTVEVGGLVFSHYAYVLTDGADGYNEFGIDRAYFIAKAKITKRIGARITLDAGRLDPLVTTAGETYTLDTKYRVFLKHAWLEWKDWAPGMSVKAGMIDTPMVPWEEKFLGTRYIGKVFADDQKQFGSADLGVNIGGEHAGGVVSWTAGVYNGEGYDKPETNSGKALEARITVDPLGKNDKMKLPITGFVDYNSQGPDADAILLYEASLGYKMKFVTIYGEYLGKSQGDVSGSGYSATLLPGMPKYGYLVARYDHFDPDGSVDKDGNDKLVIGAGHDFFDKVSLAATYERVTPEAAPDTPGHGVYLHLQAGF